VSGVRVAKIPNDLSLQGALVLLNWFNVSKKSNVR